jgi:hypothetical protein
MYHMKLKVGDKIMYMWHGLPRKGVIIAIKGSVIEVR